MEYSPRSRVTRVNRSGAYSKAVVDSRAGWNPAKGLASNSAAEAANDAAEALIADIEEKGGHAYPKIMTSSQVSSGFWANAPRGVDRHITFLEKTPISLRLPDGEEDPVDALYQREDGTWNCIWLPRKTGAGFSGGWRGFAIDLDLFPGDVCVFEIDESSKPGGRGSADVLIVHIFRAFDYENENVRERRKEDAANTAVVALKEAEAAEDSEQDDEELDFEKDESSDEEDEEEVCDGVTDKFTSEISGDGLSNEENEEVLFEKEEEDEVMIRKTRAATTARTKTRVQIIGKRKRRQAHGNSKKVEIDEEEEEEENNKIVVKPRATANHRKQTTSTPIAVATGDDKNAKKSFSRISSKKQKVNTPPIAPAPVVEKEESENEESAVEEEYFVEKIMAVKAEADGTKKYFIKWYGYPHSENSWEPIEMFNAPPEKYPRAPGVKL
jgi:Chromo (CHRromatin Organisation MOdifier) domain